MEYRRFGKTNWQVSEIGYGMWGMAGWSGSDDVQTNESLDISVEMGCNFFDTAWGYGEGRSEQLLGGLVKRHPNKKIYVATKIPPMNFKWPAKPKYNVIDCYPAAHIIEYTEKSLQNLGVDCIDLMQLHVWDDSWTNNGDWREAIEKLTKEGKVAHWGISVNRWEPNNSIEALKTGLFSSVQVIYNIFDQAPEDKLFPLCKELDIATIARVPFDEGTLTGTLTKQTTFPEGDWRASYFVPENLNASVDHADALRPLLPTDMSMPEMALRFIICNPDVGTIIPGMRKANHVKSNLQSSDGKALPQELHSELKKHRWDRLPTAWSQ